MKDDLPRGCWRLGKIIQLPSSTDGHLRSARVQLASGRVIRRALNMLYPLEVTSQNDHYYNDNNSINDIPVQPSSPVSRPVRRAAESAKLKFKNQLC